MDPVSYDNFWAQRVAKEQSLLLKSAQRVSEIQDTQKEEKPRKKKKFMRLVKKTTKDPKPTETETIDAQQTSGIEKKTQQKTSELIMQEVTKVKGAKSVK